MCLICQWSTIILPVHYFIKIFKFTCRWTWLSLSGLISSSNFMCHSNALQYIQMLQVLMQFLIIRLVACLEWTSKVRREIWLCSGLLLLLRLLLLLAHLMCLTIVSFSHFISIAHVQKVKLINIKVLNDIYGLAYIFIIRIVISRLRDFRCLRKHHRLILR